MNLKAYGNNSIERESSDSAAGYRKDHYISKRLPRWSSSYPSDRIQTDHRIHNRPPWIPSGLTISLKVSFAFRIRVVFPPVVAVTVSSIFDMDRIVTDISIQTLPPFTLVCTDRDSGKGQLRLNTSAYSYSICSNMAAVAEILIVRRHIRCRMPSDLHGPVCRAVRVAVIPARAYAPSPYWSSSISWVSGSSHNGHQHLGL